MCRLSFRQLTLFCLCLLGSSIARSACIAVLTAGGGVQFWHDVESGARAAIEQSGYTAYIRGPKDENDHDMQARILDDMRQSGCIGFVIAPNSPTRAKQVSQLKALGLPTVFIDRDIGGERISTVKTDNFQAGIRAADVLSTRLAPKSRVGLFRLRAGTPSTDQREEGFAQRLEELGFRLIFDEYLGTRDEQATRIAFDILRLHDVDAVFTPNESTSLATLSMRQRVPGGDKILHLGFDHHPRLIEAVQSGLMLGVIVQDPYEIGYQGVMTLIAHLDGSDVSEQITIPSRLLLQQTIPLKTESQ